MAMVRYTVYIALFALGTWLLARAEWLFLVAHRLSPATAITVVPPYIDAPDDVVRAHAEAAADRHHVTMTIGEIMNRTVH
jgi:hypothetical protein